MVYNNYGLKKNFINIAIRPLLIAVIGVFVIDYFSHLLFSNPMETIPYFMAKMTLYFLFSVIFLSVVDIQKNESTKIVAAGVSVSLLWGMYYNIFPLVFDYYPFGISLKELTFLEMGLFGTGLAFGIVHTLAFIGGYYSTKVIFKNF